MERGLYVGVRKINVADPLIRIIPEIGISRTSLTIYVRSTSDALRHFAIGDTVIGVGTISFRIFRRPVRSNRVVIIPAKVKDHCGEGIRVAYVFSLFRDIVPDESRVHNGILIRPLIQSIAVGWYAHVLSKAIVSRFSTRAARDP